MSSLFIPPLELAAGDLLIRAYRPGDGPALRRATAASYEHLRPWMEWARPDQSDEEAELLCRRFAASYLRVEDFVLGIWLGDELVGGTGFHPRGGSLAVGTADIGMWIGASHAGRGMGTRVLRALLDWGFSDAWPWRRLTWHCDTRNRASARVAEKGGLRREATLRSVDLDVEGRRRDVYLYAILREEWASGAAAEG